MRRASSSRKRTTSTASCPSSRSASARGLLAAARQPVDLARAIGRADGDLRTQLAPAEEPEVGVGGLERSSAVHLCLTVVGAEDHVVALEELVRPAGRVEERADRAIGVAELRGRAVRPERVRGVVVVGEVEDEEVEAVAGDEPAADGGRVGVDRPRCALADGERRAGLVRLEQVVEEEALRAERGARHTGQDGRGARCARGSR